MWRLEAFGFDLFSLLVRALPIDAASALGGRLARWIGPLTRQHKVARRNLRLAFPDMADDERQRLLADQWENVGRTFFEFPAMDRLTPASGRVEVVGAQWLAAVAQGGPPAVFVTGHFSNWEVMAAAILAAGVRCDITYRAANNPYVDERIKASRRRYGVTLFAPKGADGARELLDALQRGVSVAMMNDQKYDAGVPAMFFGRRVDTLPAAARLAIRFGATVIPLSVQRTRGARFRFIVHAPIAMPATGDRTADIAAGVGEITRFIEARIRERPAEWFWVHRRWPARDYAELAAKGL